MATLTSGISATDRSIRVTDPGSSTKGGRYRIDDELIDLEDFELHAHRAGRREPGQDNTRWRVTRGVGGSTAASHNAGAAITAAISATVSSDTLTPPTPFAGAGGGVTVDNQVDPPTAVTTIIAAPGAQITDEQATIGRGFVLSNGQLVLEIGDGLIQQLRFFLHAGDLQVFADDGGNPPEIETTPLWINSTRVRINIGSDLGDYFSVGPETAGEPRVFAVGCHNGGKDVEIALSDGSVGFFGKSPVTRPEVPASPTAQDVVDALVALGLVTQAA